MHCGTKQDQMQRFLQGEILTNRSKRIDEKCILKIFMLTKLLNYRYGIQKRHREMCRM